MTKGLIKLTFILTTCLGCLGLNKHETRKPLTSGDKTGVGFTAIAIIPFKSKQDWLFKHSKPTSLTTEDLSKIDSILTLCITEYNTVKNPTSDNSNHKGPEHQVDSQSSIIDLKRYKRQYVAVLNRKGEKEVWVNCFCDDIDLNWKKQIIMVDDGGNCYFQVKINLSTGTHYEFLVNGDA